MRQITTETIDRTWKGNVNKKSVKCKLNGRTVIDRGTLPKCISVHTLLPVDSQSGWCDLQGRKAHIEDNHAVLIADRQSGLTGQSGLTMDESRHFSASGDGRPGYDASVEIGFRLFGVFDGHHGGQAARFSSRNIPDAFRRFLCASDHQMYVDELQRLVTLYEHVNCCGSETIPEPEDLHASTCELGNQDIGVKIPSMQQQEAGFSDNLPSLCRCLSNHVEIPWLAGRVVMNTSEVLATYDTSPQESSENQGNHVAVTVTLTGGDYFDAALYAFLSTNHEFLTRSHLNERSGNTATVAILLGEEPAQNTGYHSNDSPKYTHLLIANIGDSRAVLCCSEFGAAAPVTTDHTAHNIFEQSRVVQRGGIIRPNRGGSVLRVNGELAVTRSIGDRPLRHLLSPFPDMMLLRIREGKEILGDSTIREKVIRDSMGESEMGSSSCSIYFFYRALLENQRRDREPAGRALLTYMFIILATVRTHLLTLHSLTTH